MAVREGGSVEWQIQSSRGIYHALNPFLNFLWESDQHNFITTFLRFAPR